MGVHQIKITLAVQLVSNAEFFDLILIISAEMPYFYGARNDKQFIYLDAF